MILKLIIAQEQKAQPDTISFAFEGILACYHLAFLFYVSATATEFDYTTTVTGSLSDPV